MLGAAVRMTATVRRPPFCDCSNLLARTMCTAPPDDKPRPKTGFKQMMAQYGPVFLVYWTGLWAANLGLVYGTIEYSGMVDTLVLLQYTGLDSHVSPGAGNLAAAVALNEGLEVARFPFTVATTPAVPAGQGHERMAWCRWLGGGGSARRK